MTFSDDSGAVLANGVDAALAAAASSGAIGLGRYCVFCMSIAMKCEINDPAKAKLIKTTAQRNTVIQ